MSKLIIWVGITDNYVFGPFYFVDIVEIQNFLAP